MVWPWRPPRRSAPRRSSTSSTLERWQLAARAPQLLARLPAANYSAEIQRTTVETNTDVVTTLDGLRREIRGCARGVMEVAAREGLGIAAVGTAARSEFRDFELTATGRYGRMQEQYRLLVDEQLICGTQIHVGVADRELAVDVAQRIARHLPVLLALSASSPYWNGQDTGYASIRTIIWQRWPSAGATGPLEDAAEYDRLLADLIRSGVIADAKMAYFDVRPSAHAPTLELRVCDACPLVDDAVLLAGLFRAVVRTAEVEIASGAPRRLRALPLHRAALWQAARGGLAGRLLDDSDHPEPVLAATAVRTLIDRVRDALEEARRLTTRSPSWRSRCSRAATPPTASGRPSSARATSSDVMRLVVAETQGPADGGVPSVPALHRYRARAGDEGVGPDAVPRAAYEDVVELLHPARPLGRGRTRGAPGRLGCGARARVRRRRHEAALRGRPRAAAAAPARMGRAGGRTRAAGPGARGLPRRRVRGGSDREGRGADGGAGAPLPRLAARGDAAAARRPPRPDRGLRRRAQRVRRLAGARGQPAQPVRHRLRRRGAPAAGRGAARPSEAGAADGSRGRLRAAAPHRARAGAARHARRAAVERAREQRLVRAPTARRGRGPAARAGATTSTWWAAASSAVATARRSAPSTCGSMSSSPTWSTGPGVPSAPRSSTSRRRAASGSSTPPGNGVADDKAMYRSVPELIGYYLDERPILEGVPTYRTGDDLERQAVLERVGELVDEAGRRSGGHGVLIGPDASAVEVAARRVEIAANPGGWVAQEVVPLSSVPSIGNGLLQPRHVDLRAFVYATGRRRRDVVLTTCGLHPRRARRQPRGQLLARGRREGHLAAPRAPHGAVGTMCGIAGEVRFDGRRPDTDAVQRMTACLVHRGPDGEGLWQHGGTALGHRRLAIIDLSAGRRAADGRRGGQGDDRLQRLHLQLRDPPRRAARSGSPLLLDLGHGGGPEGLAGVGRGLRRALPRHVRARDHRARQRPRRARPRPARHQAALPRRAPRPAPLRLDPAGAHRRRRRRHEPRPGRHSRTTSASTRSCRHPGPCSPASGSCRPRPSG